MSTTENLVITKLTDAGVSDAAIDILREQEMLDENLLAAATPEQLTSIGLTLGAVLKVKQTYPSAATPAAATPVAVAPAVAPGPITVVLEKKPADMSFAELVRAYVQDKKMPGLREAMRKAIGNHTVFVIIDEGVLDIERTIQAFEHFDDTGSAPTEIGGLPTFTFDQVLNVTRHANPWTGKAAEGALAQLPFDDLVFIAYMIITGELKNEPVRAGLASLIASLGTDIYKAVRTKFERAKNNNEKQYLDAVARHGRPSSGKERPPRMAVPTFSVAVPVTVSTARAPCSVQEYPDIEAEFRIRRAAKDLNFSTHDTVMKGGPYSTLVVRSSHIRLDRVIVIGRVEFTAQCSNVTGTIYTPIKHNVLVTKNGNYINIDTKFMTWVALYRLLIETGWYPEPM